MSDLAKKANNLILIGFMGTGKTSVGKRVAQSLNLKFVDTDALIVQKEGKTIQAIFEDAGEEAFRKIETAVLKECTQSGGKVISTGGGVLTQEGNIPILKSGGRSIWLKSSARVIYERVRRNFDRPLLNNDDPEKTISDLLEARETDYANCSELTISTDELSLEETIYGVTETARFWKIG